LRQYLSNLVTRSESFCFHSLNTNGPVPMGATVPLSSRASISGAIMRPELAIDTGYCAQLCLRYTRTDSGPVTSTWS
jgi:hypothetical protein